MENYLSGGVFIRELNDHPVLKAGDDVFHNMGNFATKISNVKHTMKNVVSLPKVPKSQQMQMGGSTKLNLDYSVTPLLKHAEAHDKIEIWATGPSVPGLKCCIRIEEATIKADSNPPTTSKQIQCKLGTNVFSGQSGLLVNLDSTGVYNDSSLRNKALEYIAADATPGTVLTGGPANQGNTKDGIYQPVPMDDVVVTVSKSQYPEKPKSVTDAVSKAIDERVNLLPGISPLGYVYRLSDVFDKHGGASVGEATLGVNTIGGFRYDLPAKVKLKHVPTLHWFCPNYQLTCDKSALVCPRVEDAKMVYHGAKEDARFNFLLERIIMLGAI